MNARHSLATVELHTDGTLGFAPIGAAMTPAVYSRFKHGDTWVAEQYGVRLAHLAAPLVHRLHASTDIVVTSSGYDIAPTAAHSLLAPFVATLRTLANRAIRTTKVDRTRPSPRDYASMNELERRRSIEGTLCADTSDVAGTHVLAVDDVLVTGLHEDAMSAALQQAAVARVDHLYVLDASPLRDQPDIEARLNRAAIASVADLAALAEQPAFTPNTRVARMVLSAPDHVIDHFAATAPAHVLDWFTHIALNDRLADTPDCRRGARRLAIHARSALAPAT